MSFYLGVSHKCKNKHPFKLNTTKGWISVKKKSKFNMLLLESIDEGLKEIFGETATGIIYNYLKDKYSLKREEISEKLEVFIEGLEAFFSSSAACVVKKNVLKNFYSTFGLQYQNEEGRSFIDHVTKLRSSEFHI